MEMTGRFIKVLAKLTFGMGDAWQEQSPEGVSLHLLRKGPPSNGWQRTASQLSEGRDAQTDRGKHPEQRRLGEKMVE